MDLLHSYAACCNPLRHPHFPTLNRLVVGSIPTASTISSLESIGYSHKPETSFHLTCLAAVLTFAKLVIALG